MTPIAAGETVPDAVLAGARHWQRGGAAGNRLLVVSFTSPRCREEGPCAEAERKLRAVQDGLGQTRSLNNSVGLLTLSLDPARDVPAALRVQADQAGADATKWRFAALPANQVDAIRARFGVRPDATLTAIVDAGGRLARIYPGADWTPEDVIRDLASLALRADPAVLSAYIAAQEALSVDDAAAARRALVRLTRVVGEPEVSRLADTAATARDLSSMRAAFKPLSEALVRLPWPPEYQPMYCPMFDGNAGATWVQKAGPVINPYYGQAMLRCGSDLSLGAHADHTPQYGGILFMAADAFHHVEGTYTADGVFRVRVYDNFRKPMLVTRFSGRVEVGGTDRSVRLAPAADRQTLDARLGTLAFPAEITLLMTLDPRASEERFDFVFPAFLGS